MSSTTRTTARIIALALLAGGCQRTETPLPSDTAAAPTAKESPGALATRHEAQAMLDRARLAFERKDLEASRSELAGAAAFMRSEAQTAVGEAKNALNRAADELDALAAKVSKGEVQSVAALDQASLSVNRGEATRHLLLAKDAIATRDNARAGEELTMSIDHLERAAKDAGVQGDSLVRAAIADARTLAGEMMKGVGAAADEATRVTDGLANAIGRLGVRVTKES